VDLQELAALGAGLNLLAALVGFPVLWERVRTLSTEVAELRRNVRQLELGHPAAPTNPGDRPHG